VAPKLLKVLRMKTSTLIAVAAALGLTTGAAQAAMITGGVVISGGAVLDNPNPTLATSASVVLAFGAGSSGSFNPAISVGTPVGFTTPLVNGVTSGLIWWGGGFTFSATGPISFTGQDSNSLGIIANGVVDDGPGGFDPTPAVFTMALTKGVGGLFGFGSVTAADPSNDVPDAGSALLFLGLGLVGVGVSRRLAV
jgi:hypothetical protein